MNRSKSYKDKSPLIYLIASPIGNLGEFSPRAIEIIETCDLVAAEDTRNTASLLAKFNLKKPIHSLREHNERSESITLVNLAKEGKKIAYLSDAGYPGISDPGNILVDECIKNGVNVSTVSGSSAFLNALVASGLPSNHFYFHGFLSPIASQAKLELNELKKKKETIIFYEAPHRIEKTIKLLSEELGDRNAVIARELTKINEEYIRGSLNELTTLDFSTLKGEMVIIISGNNKQEGIDYLKMMENIKYLTKKGLSLKDAVDVLTTLFGYHKNAIYDIATKCKENK